MRFVSSLQQELEDACDFSWYKALVKIRVPTKFLTLIKNVGCCMHWNSAVRRSWITYFSWLASQVLAFHDEPSLTSSLQSKMILICSIYGFWITFNCFIRTSSIYQRSIRQRSSELNFFCCEAFEILAFFFLAIVISLLICLCLSLSVLWKPAKSYLLDVLEAKR